MSKALLEVKDLHVRVEEKEILHGVNLTVGHDETHVLMGPNGTGKSTLGYAMPSPAIRRTASPPAPSCLTARISQRFQ